MMTCVSLRSGMASSGICAMDHHPRIPAAAVSKKMMNLFWAENSIIRLIIPGAFWLYPSEQFA